MPQGPPEEMPHWFEVLSNKIYAKHNSYLPLDLTDKNVVAKNFKYKSSQYAGHQRNEMQCKKYVDEVIKRWEIDLEDWKNHATVVCSSKYDTLIAKAQSLANQENLTEKAKRTWEEKVMKLQIKKNQHWNAIVRI